MRALNPFKPTPDLITFQRPQLPVTSLWELGYQPMNVCLAGGWGHRYSVCSSSLDSLQCEWRSESSTVLQGELVSGSWSCSGTRVRRWPYNRVDSLAKGRWKVRQRLWRGLQYLCETAWSLEHEGTPQNWKNCSLSQQRRPEVQRWIFHNSVFKSSLHKLLSLGGPWGSGGHPLVPWNTCHLTIIWSNNPYFLPIKRWSRVTFERTDLGLKR